MGNYLLTGAGFNKYFGAWLCDELTAYFFNALMEHKDKSIRQVMLGKNNNNFEEIYSSLSTIFPENKNEFREILHKIFQEMFDNISASNKSSTQWIEKSIESFFWNFDQVFTLNQDHLIKKANRQANKELSKPRKGEILNKKNYIELHGAFDWEEAFIFGGNKEDYIQNHPQLKKYHDFFEKSLIEPNSKLVIIGYSFLDGHINKVIKKGIDEGLKIFIWDPNVGYYLDGFKSSVKNKFFVRYDDDLAKVNLTKNDFKRSVYGYLPKTFDLDSDDKNQVTRFLNLKF